ncbi:hypothetical protein GQ55_1G060200 [Panicum hallii var. hallii]|uniref:Uncharacterized protein n=1 Tax=Panicum hallii var. hallii TaxID=1504633 RepID=A0A2T7F2T2_9POAL|nr:hypothetical protein GQ55_1G060200 [Panicum hallii var. hallii]
MLSAPVDQFSRHRSTEELETTDKPRELGLHRWLHDGVRHARKRRSSSVPINPSVQHLTSRPAGHPVLRLRTRRQGTPRARRHSSACRAMNRKQPVRVRDAPAT